VNTFPYFRTLNPDVITPNLSALFNWWPLKPIARAIKNLDIGANYVN